MIKINNRQDAKAYVIATIKSGDRNRICKVIERYRQKYWKKKEDTSYKDAVEIFK